MAADEERGRWPNRRLRLRTRLGRRRLDRELLSGSEPTRDPFMLERARQLTSRSARINLAGLLERVLDVAREPEWRPRAVVTIQRASVRMAAPDIGDLIELLRGPDRISAQGVLMAYRLLTNAASPLYHDYGDERRLVFAARRISDGLRYGPRPAL